MRCVPIQVFPNALTSLNSAAHCRRDDRENRSFIRPGRTIIYLRPRYAGRTGFQRPREQAVSGRADVAEPKSLCHPLFSCAHGIQTGASECVLKADRFSSYGQNPGTVKVGKVNQGREIVNRRRERSSLRCFRFFRGEYRLDFHIHRPQHWLYEAVNRRDSGTHPCGILDQSPMGISR